MANETLPNSNHSVKPPQAVVDLTIASSSISVFCCLIFLLTYVVWKDMRLSPRRLLFYMALADLFCAASYAFGAIRNSQTAGYENSTIACVGQSFVSTLSSMCSCFWMVALGVYLLVTIVTVDPVCAEKLMKYFYPICWGVPLGVVILGK